MPQRLVVLAAGTGQRLRRTCPEALKPLADAGGMPLIVRVLLGAQHAGIHRADIVLGYRGDEIREALTSRFSTGAMTLRFFENPAWSRTANGVSLLAAADDRSPCLLAMADHLFDDTLFQTAQRAAPPDGSIALLIDRKLSTCFDLDDATKVQTHGALITAIGKQLSVYDALDCGLFSLTAAVFDVLASEVASRGDCSITDAMRQFAASGRLLGVDVGAARWHDVDTEEALAHTQSLFPGLAARLHVGARCRPLTQGAHVAGVDLDIDRTHSVVIAQVVEHASHRLAGIALAGEWGAEQPGQMRRGV